MSPDKCEYFDKGYYKNKNNCLLKHPLVECDSQCDDKRKCQKRHRSACKNSEKCQFLSSESCEFLNINKTLEVNEGRILQMKTELETKIAERLSLLDTKEKETKLRIDSILEIAPVKSSTSPDNNVINDIEESLKDLDKNFVKHLQS